MIQIDENELRALLVWVRRNIVMEQAEPIVNTLNKWLDSSTPLTEVPKKQVSD
jgi:hypothetical protein